MIPCPRNHKYMILGLKNFLSITALCSRQFALLALGGEAHVYVQAQAKDMRVPSYG